MYLFNFGVAHVRSVSVRKGGCQACVHRNVVRRNVERAKNRGDVSGTTSIKPTLDTLISFGVAQSATAMPPTSIIPLSDLISQIAEYASTCSGASTSSSPSLDAEAAQSLSDELVALQAIYAPDDDDLRVVSLNHQSEGGHGGEESHVWVAGSTKIRMELKLALDLPRSKGTNADAAPESFRLSITLPPYYPSSLHRPQLQLLDRFIGPYEVDTSLFGQVLRTLNSNQDPEGDGNAVQVILFEGCENVKEKVENWYRDKERERVEREKQDPRSAAGTVSTDSPTPTQQLHRSPPTPPSQSYAPSHASQPSRLECLASSKRWTSTEAVLERKSTFIGHAITLTESGEVPYLLSTLLQKYPRMGKATHPLMRAWVCRDAATGVVERDNDDDGESAAGGRLAHLLDMLHCENVLVVVSRWYGGVHLGADRFKLINRVARDALEAADLIPIKGGKK